MQLIYWCGLRLCFGRMARKGICIMFHGLHYVCVCCCEIVRLRRRLRRVDVCAWGICSLICLGCGGFAPLETGGLGGGRSPQYLQNIIYNICYIYICYIMVMVYIYY